MAQRISILHPTSDITALKLRGWLTAEAEEIEGACERGDTVLVRLFLLESVRYGFTQKKMDALLQGVVDKYPSIQRIELNLVKTPLTMEQMREVVEEHHPFPDLRRYLGYRQDDLACRQDDLVCMVSNIIEANQKPVSQQAGIAFAVGEWFVSSGAHEATKVHGPFASEQDAMNHATSLGCDRFTRID